MKLHFIICIVCLLLSCSGDNDGHAEIQHPIIKYIPNNNEVIKQRDNFTQNNDVELSGIKPEGYISSITDAEFSFSIGRESGKQIEVFGSITDVEIDSDNNIYVLDSRGVTIRKYDSTGNLLNVYGGVKGRGPTDLFRPVDIEIGINGNIYVADAFNEIKILHTTGRGIEYKESILTPGIMAVDMCIMEDELFIRSVAENKAVSDTTLFNLVHVYSLKNHTYIRGFGSIYKSPRFDTNSRLSGGFAKIGCQESTDTIVYGFEYFPYLYGYSSQGKLKWVSKTDPFKGLGLKETVRDGRAIKWSFNYDEGDLISSIAPFADDSFLVQVRRIGKNIDTKFSSYIVSSGNGSIKYLGEIFPQISSLNDTTLITENINSYPGVKVFKH